MSVTVLDGGFSTQLARYVGDIIDGDPLWSARFLSTAPEAVAQTHLDFLNAGAEVIITNSYQASVDGFRDYLGLDKTSSIDLIKKSARLAQQAREQFLKDNPSEKPPLIAGSVGSYGASLHDGSEYNGSFIPTTTRDTLKNWHRPRFQALLEVGVDLLAIETIPALEEALALIELLKEFPKAKAWLSFQCKDGFHLGYGDDFGDAAHRCWAESGNQLVAIGCNCLDPELVTSLLKNVGRDVPTIVYPNSGEQYSPHSGWSGKDLKPNIADYIEEWLNLGVRYVGGCCRTDAKDVKAIKKSVKNWLLKNQ